MRVNRGYAKNLFQTCGLSASGAEELVNGQNVSDSVDQYISNGERFKSSLDSMSDTSELSSLRLQMMMDRRSKFFSTLSNILKKVSDTQNTITQNLK